MMDYKCLTIDCVLDTLRENYPDKPAVVFEEESVTFQELYNKSITIAENLIKLGVKKNDKVAVLLPNCLEYLYVYFAVFKIGAWIVPISTRYEPDEIKRVLVDSDVETIIYQDKVGIFNYNNILLNNINSYLTKIKNYIVLGDDIKDGVIPFSCLLEKSDVCIENMDLEEIYPDDIAILGYTSGTTGHPKGVMITHKNLIQTSYYGGKVLKIDDEIGFSVAPLYAAQGFNAVLLYFVSCITMKWISNFNPNDILSHITKKHINLFHTQPTMWSLILAMHYYKYGFFKELNKVVVSGSLCTPYLARKIEDTTKCTLINAYGIIEATGVVTMTRLDDPKDVRLNTVGKPLEGFQLKIVDKDRKEVPKGEIGELAIKGYLMKGYYKNEEKTKEVIDEEGWLYTGDLACYYKDGVNVCIVGRCKDMVIRGGFNVYPVDIEECLLNFEKVEDVSVVGEDDEILGESLVAFVIQKPGQHITEGEIKAFCRGKIANYKVPDRVIFVSQFPTLESGKIQKNILKKWSVEGIPAECKFLLNDSIVKGIAKDE
ncbi:acyl--CoA ligase [Clostridium estertheticum]|uniref:class I adenylate-forming enzyme family protein n=1 Tax=Clostridium estertheticum TaxID=238834 RepID=UPI0013EEC1ED|nr:class I adenylate-forming enzyme family protein [Clostridium estertheticum]MBZ9609067.1 acyl--CoA ligase [Clostridium estertheticum]